MNWFELYCFQRIYVVVLILCYQTLAHTAVRFGDLHFPFCFVLKSRLPWFNAIKLNIPQGSQGNFTVPQ